MQGYNDFFKPLELDYNDCFLRFLSKQI